MKIGLLISGGVDSSTALMKLRELHPDADIRAYYIKIWLEDEVRFLGDCPWQEDIKFARAVCEILGIELKIVSLQKEYWEKVIDYTLKELKTGRTPSPDIFCNKRIKFGTFLDKIGESLDKIATGHYARVSRDTDGIYRIRRSPDPVKDQTYFLSQLTQNQAALAMFPIGEMTKSQVRKLAQLKGLPVCDRADSQGICFLGEIKYTDFLKHYLGEKEGDIIEAFTGRHLGKHRGTWFYTIGQRTGLGLSGGPWYVVARDRNENLITVAREPEAIAVASREINVVEPNWISGIPVKSEIQLKLRHGPGLVPGIMEGWDKQGKKGKGFRIQMSEADRGIAAGQFAVIYDGEICLGSAKVAEDTD